MIRKEEDAPSEFRKDLQECLFCRIVAGEVPAQLVHEDPACVAFRDINPQAPVHVLIVPREHIATLDDAGDQHVELLGTLLTAARRIASAHKIGRSYRVVINCGAPAGQSVFHIHVHLLGGRSMGWPPG